MVIAKIFISHSTKTAEAEAYLDALETTLKQDPRFELLLDRNGLRPGDDWRDRLWEWMDEAHAAILLLSKDVFESKFVPIELAILSYRHYRKQNFPLIIVLVGEVNLNEANGTVLGELDLDRIQCVRGHDANGSAQEVVRALGHFLTVHGRIRTPMELLFDEATSSLEAAAVSLTDLQELALEVPDLQLRQSGDIGESRKLAARAILGAEFNVACRALTALATRRRQAKCEFQNILQLVAPLWVERTCADPIAEVALAGCVQRVLLLNAVDAWTAHAFISRARCTPLRSGLVVELGPPEQEESTASIERQLCRFFKPKTEPETPSLQRLKKLLTKHERERTPVFVVFPRTWPPPVDVLQGFRGEYLTPTVLVMGVEDHLVAAKQPARVLQAPSKEREDDAITEYLTTANNIEKA